MAQCSTLSHFLFKSDFWCEYSAMVLPTGIPRYAEYRFNFWTNVSNATSAGVYSLKPQPNEVHTSAHRVGPQFQYCNLHNTFIGDIASSDTESKGLKLTIAELVSRNWSLVGVLDHWETRMYPFLFLDTSHF